MLTWTISKKSTWTLGFKCYSSTARISSALYYFLCAFSCIAVVFWFVLDLCRCCKCDIFFHPVTSPLGGLFCIPQRRAFAKIWRTGIDDKLLDNLDHPWLPSKDPPAEEINEKTPIIGLISDALRCFPLGFIFQFRHEDEAYFGYSMELLRLLSRASLVCREQCQGSYYLLPLWCAELQRRELRRMAFGSRVAYPTPPNMLTPFSRWAAINSCCANSFSSCVLAFFMRSWIGQG